MNMPFKKYLTSRKIRQVGSLYTAMILMIALGFVISVINTRTLGPERYGDYKFINNLFHFMSILAGFGLTYTGSQLIAQLHGEEEKKYRIIGANILFTAAFSVCFILMAIGFSFLEPALFGNNLNTAILVFSPLVFVFIFSPAFENILQGDNRIHELSLFRVLPQLLFMCCLLFFTVFLNLNLETTLTLQFITGAAVTFLYYRKLRPSYHKIKETAKMIWQANKSYGWFVYIGSLSNVATAYLSTFMISYFLDNTRVGYFSLAYTLTLPLMQVASVVGTTYFKDFAQRDLLPRKVTILTTVVTIVSTLAFIVIIKPIVVLAYTVSFEEVAAVSSIIAFGSALQGMGDYYNRFLGAHRRGKELRNGAIAAGVVNILGYFFLVKYFGIDGAAWTKVVAGGIYFALMRYYYYKYRHEYLAGSRDILK